MKAHDKKKEMAKKISVKDEGYGNVNHLSKTVKRGKASFRGISHWSKDPKDAGKEY